MLEPQTTVLSHRLQTANQPIHYSLMWLILIFSLGKDKKTKQKPKTLPHFPAGQNKHRSKQTVCLIEIILLEIQCTVQLLEEKGKVLWVGHQKNSDSHLTAEADTDHKPKNDADAQ